jgi:hypothetical protein
VFDVRWCEEVLCMGMPCTCPDGRCMSGWGVWRVEAGVLGLCSSCAYVGQSCMCVTDVCDA